MGLTCHCPDDGMSWWYYGEGSGEVSPLNTKRARRCSSCRQKIAVGDDCMRFSCFRSPNDEIEERIHGEEVRIAPKFLCDRCAGLYESLSSLGFCLDITESMVDLCKQYAEMQREAGVFRGEMVVRGVAP